MGASVSNGPNLRGRSAADAPGATGSLTSWLLERFCAGLRPSPMEVVLWNGTRVALSDQPPLLTVRVNHPRALRRVFWNPVDRLAEAYRRGDIDLEGDIAAAAEAVFRRPEEAGTVAPPADPHLAPGAVLRRASRNARHHYDVGNEFYRLWLDEELLYTCAYFETPEVTLEQAQIAKMEHVCRKVRLRPGDRVVEAGCGWGSFALYMARTHGVHVTACTVSKEQAAYARARCAKEGLEDRVTFLEDDFRNVAGRFDVVVSIGMLEHVGRKNYAGLGRWIHDRLDPVRGRGLLHFIGRSHPRPLDPWIRRHIFPGAYPPGLSEVMARVLEPWDIAVTDVENLRPHYAKTLEHWNRRFEAHVDTIRTMYDDAFVRTWRLYLAGSQAAFASGWLQLFQVAFGNRSDDGQPWTRRALYA